MCKSPFYSLFAQMRAAVERVAPKKGKPHTARAYFSSYWVAHDFRKGLRKLGLPAFILPKAKGWQVGWQYPTEY